MADYTIQYHASDYASKRYFKAFVKMRIFVEDNSGRNFTVNYEEKDYIQRIFHVTFPQPQPQPQPKQPDPTP